DSEKQMSKRILVTGGAGYVGSACLRHLLSHGFDAIAYDNLVQGHRESVPQARLVVGDIADTSALTAALRELNADAVMHFAAAISPMPMAWVSLSCAISTPPAHRLMENLAKITIRKIISSR